MEALLDALRANQVILYFVYGQVFFSLGIILIFHSHKNSRLALARHLNWLAAFAAVHGMTAWSHLFIPIQATYISPGIIELLEDAHTLALALSYFLLFQFGIRLVWPSSGRRLALHFCSVVLVLVWIGASPAFEAIDNGIHMFSALALPQTESSTRVVLGLTSGVVTALGFHLQARQLKRTGQPAISRYFLWTALGMLVFAVTGGLAVPRSVGSTEELEAYLFLTEIPIFPAPLFRTLVGIGIAYGVIRVLEIFRLERIDRRRKEEVRAQLLGHVISAQEEERKRVARELHDDTGQKLSAVIIGLGTVADRLSRGLPTGVDHLTDTREVAVEALQSIRQVIHGLRPPVLDDLGLAPALRKTAEELSRIYSMEFEVVAHGLNGSLSPETEIVLFRILQEGMNNAARHSNGRRVLVQIKGDGSSLSAQVQDDGVGFDCTSVIAHTETGRGLGLIGMQERASLLGGEVRIESTPGRGTRLFVQLPLTSKEVE